jgi:hypothetical protein
VDSPATPDVIGKIAAIKGVLAVRYLPADSAGAHG